MTAAAVLRSWAVAGADDRVLGLLFVVAGCFMLFLVLFADGALIALVLGTGLGSAPLHELRHDGRHLRGAPCH